MRVLVILTLFFLSSISAESTSDIVSKLNEALQKNRMSAAAESNSAISLIRNQAKSLAAEFDKYSSSYAQSRSQLSPQGLKLFAQIEAAINDGKKIQSDFNEGNLRQDFDAMSDMISTIFIKSFEDSNKDLKRAADKKKNGTACYSAKKEEIKSLASEFFNKTVTEAKQEIITLDVNLKAIQNEMATYRNSTIDEIKKCNKEKLCVQKYVS